MRRHKFGTLKQRGHRRHGRQPKQERRKYAALRLQDDLVSYEKILKQQFLDSQQTERIYDHARENIERIKKELETLRIRLGGRLPSVDDHQDFFEEVNHTIREIQGKET